MFKFRLGKSVDSYSLSFSCFARLTGISIFKFNFKHFCFFIRFALTRVFYTISRDFLYKYYRVAVFVSLDLICFHKFNTGDLRTLIARNSIEIFAFYPFAVFKCILSQLRHAAFIFKIDIDSLFIIPISRRMSSDNDFGSLISGITRWKHEEENPS